MYNARRCNEKFNSSNDDNKPSPEMNSSTFGTGHLLTGNLDPIGEEFYCSISSYVHFTILLYRNAQFAICKKRENQSHYCHGSLISQSTDMSEIGFDVVR
mmetsp:Transcript_39182/g.59049  ORF Transcript_39182/g.59049 Transcript_39182/m.59049 type:complete len:100 (-) Transcript_39182:314-613(-)